MDEGLQVGVVEQVAQLVFDVAVVDVHPHGPQFERRPGGLDPLGAVEGVYADMVPGPDALCGEMVGEAVRPRLHLCVRAPFVAGDQVVTLTERVGCRLEQVCEVELH